MVRDKERNWDEKRRGEMKRVVDGERERKGKESKWERLKKNRWLMCQEGTLSKRFLHQTFFPLFS